MYLEKNENTNSKKYMHPNVQGSIIYNSQDVEAIQVPINRQMDKENVVCMCLCVCINIIEYYSAIKKNEILSFAAMWMDLENIMLCEISQTNKYCMISLICGK